MIINLKGTQLDLTFSLKKFIEIKLQRLQKYIDHIDKNNVAMVDVEVGRTTRHHKKGSGVYRAEINLSIPQKLLRAEATGENIRSALLESVREIEREIRKYKTKYRDARIRTARRSKK